MIWGMTSSFSKTFLFVRSNVNYKPAFSKISTQGTVIENLRLASIPGHDYCWWKWYSHRQNWEERFPNISSLVCMVQALQSYPVMIALFVEKKRIVILALFLFLDNCTIVLMVFPYVTLFTQNLFRWLNVRPLFVRYHSCLLTLTSGRS